MPEASLLFFLAYRGYFSYNGKYQCNCEGTEQLRINMNKTGVGYQ